MASFWLRLLRLRARDNAGTGPQLPPRQTVSSDWMSPETLRGPLTGNEDPLRSSGLFSAECRLAPLGSKEMMICQPCPLRFGAGASGCAGVLFQAGAQSACRRRLSLHSHHVHSALLSRLQKSRSVEDVFPTLYRCNTIRSIRRQMSAHGFRAAVYGHTSEPLYPTFSRLAYALEVLHQRFAPRAWGLTIFAFGQLVA
jgi:hypothetical protein